MTEHTGYTFYEARYEVLMLIYFTIFDTGNLFFFYPFSPVFKYVSHNLMYPS